VDGEILQRSPASILHSIILGPGAIAVFFLLRAYVRLLGLFIGWWKVGHLNSQNFVTVWMLRIFCPANPHGSKGFSRLGLCSGMLSLPGDPANPSSGSTPCQVPTSRFPTFREIPVSGTHDDSKRIPTIGESVLSLPRSRAPRGPSLANTSPPPVPRSDRCLCGNVKAPGS
jgi:hypothetical protein